MTWCDRLIWDLINRNTDVFDRHLGLTDRNVVEGDEESEHSNPFYEFERHGSKGIEVLPQLLL